MGWGKEDEKNMIENTYKCVIGGKKTFLQNTKKKHTGMFFILSYSFLHISYMFEFYPIWKELQKNCQK